VPVPPNCDARARSLASLLCDTAEAALLAHGRDRQAPTGALAEGAAHPTTGFLVCLITTVTRDIGLSYARRIGGYAVEVLPKRLRDRPDLVDVITRAWGAGQSLLAIETD